jgi:flagellar biosynthetic protein FlhB
MSSSAERTEKATPKRREDARKKGQIARGPDLPAALAFLGALVMLKFLSENFFDQIGFNIRDTAHNIANFKPMTDADLHLLVLGAGKSLALLSLPIIAMAFAGVVVGNFAQGGLSFAGEALMPKPEKFSPAKNIKKLFGTDSIVNLGKSLIKLIFVGFVAYGVLQPVIESAPSFVGAPLETVAVRLGETIYSLAIRCAILFVVLAAADYGYAYYKHEKSLRMSKQDIRDEYKQQEGDPFVKSQRRRAARALAQSRSITQVPTASVIITNPTHFAIALRYDREKDAAPIVVAKGADVVAAKIREIARANDIPLVENAPLARALYKSVEPNQIIPVEFFAAVAEILAYVFRRNEG